MALRNAAAYMSQASLPLRKCIRFFERLGDCAVAIAGASRAHKNARQTYFMWLRNA